MEGQTVSQCQTTTTTTTSATMSAAGAGAAAGGGDAAAAAANAAASATEVNGASSTAAAAVANAAPAPSKWIVLDRDYAVERQVLASALKEEVTPVHPLLPKDVMLRLAKRLGAPLSVVTGNGASTGAASASSTTSSTGSSATAGAAAASPLHTGATTPSAVDVQSILNKSTKQNDDPLSMMASSSSSSSSSSSVFDPLRSSASSSSPSSATSTASSSTASTTASSSLSASSASTRRGAAGTAIVGNFEPWKEKKLRILNKYTTNKQIGVSANFLDDDTKDRVVKQTDVHKARLEELENEAGVASRESKNYLTQREYIQHIEEQHQRLRNAWENGERVLALKIAIQCAKLLGDTTVPQFYPSMYVLLTDILDSFGDLVFDRIKRKGVETMNAQTRQIVSSALAPSFAHTDVSPGAQETCRNWFYKTACIRELMPRLYVEMALLKCYRFLEPASTFVQHFQRLFRSIRGIANPLCSAYARAYLAMKVGDLYLSFHAETSRSGEARHIPPEYQPSMIESFDDFMFIFKNCAEAQWPVQALRDNKIELGDYLDLMSPALEWLTQCVAYRSPNDLFLPMLKQAYECANESVVVHPLLLAFEPVHASTHAVKLLGLIKECKDSTAVPKSKLYLALGRALMQHPPPQDERLKILNDVWKIVSKMTNAADYIEIAEVFIQYILHNFSDREVNIFLKDVIKHVKNKDNAYKTLQEPLAKMVTHIMNYSKDLRKTLSMDTFLPILDLLEKKSRLVAAKAVLEQFSKNGFATADPVIIHTLFDVARTLHESVDSLTFDDEKRQIGTLIIGFIRRVDYGRDLETQLNTYVEFRQAFSRLELVTSELVLRTALLASKAHSFVRGNHTKKTAAFVKACMAYCHITAPSLDDVFLRLRLLLVCGQVALVNSMVVQAEGFLKAAISLVADVPATLEVMKMQQSTEDELVAYLREFTSFLLVFPGHPEHGPFYLVKGLLNTLQAYEPWKDVASPGKIKVFLGVLALFFAYAQRTFAYHIVGVESNDALYGGTADYMSELASFIDPLIAELLALLTKLGERTDIVSRKHQGTLALEFADLLVHNLQMNTHSATLVVRLVLLAYKCGNAVDATYLERTMQALKSKKGSSWYQNIAQKIEASK